MLQTFLKREDGYKADLRPQGFCTVGAIRQAAGMGWESENEPSSVIYRKAIRELNRHFAMGHGDVVSWNDRSSQTKDGVITGLRNVVHAV